MISNRYCFSLIILLLLLVSCQPVDSPSPSLPPVETPVPATAEKISPADTPSEPGRGFFMGVLPVPVAGQSFEDVYHQMADICDFVPVWGRPTPFYDLAAELEGEWGESFVEQYIRGNGMFPVIHLSFIGAGMTLASPAGISGATLSNREWRQAYKEAALAVVKTVKPLYISLGNEVNRWYEAYGADEGNPDGFQNYVSLYEEIYDAVKEISPETKVFCTFAREVVSENREADMKVLEMFNPEKLDLLVLTSYPHAVQGINRPGDIPDDYYSNVADYMPGKELAFSEVAWPSLDAFGGEESQAVFLNHLTERLTVEQGLAVDFIGWPWSTDLSADDYIGLVKADGTPKQAYHAWRSLFLLGRYLTREQTIPDDAVKITPDVDPHPPELHSDEYEIPVPLSAAVNSAGAEDSPFIMPDGRTLYFFFTPDVRVPVEKQLLDGVTGIYVSEKLADGSWGKAERVILCDDISLDGCTFVQGKEMWFCSARQGYTGMNWFTAELDNGLWQDWRYASDEFPESFEVGELHFSNDGREVYFHSSRPGGQGGYDIWFTENINGQWQEPENIAILNTEATEGWPFLSQDGSELWFTRTYYGTPAVFRSKKVGGEWLEPELIISQFAGEPSLDDYGNIYFVHHYFRDGVMLEADIYIARKK